jgi:outer membrane receptor for ferrienterochelin and colicin
MFNMRSTPTFVLLMILLSTCVVAQNTTRPRGIIEGRVTERSTGQSVPGAAVSVRNVANATSDGEGRFSLELPPGVYDVKVSAAGFAAIERNHIGVTGGRTTPLDVSLEITVDETVEVRSTIFGEHVEQPVSNITLDREAMRQTPGSGGDPLRALNSLPAVSAASGEFADLIVRGGTTDENLVFIDRVPVDDFTYFTDKYDGNRGGRAAMLAPDVFDRVDFSAGGFGARYGDRMSSVLDVTLREANRKRLQGVLFLDSGTAGGSVDIPLGQRGSWMISGRRSFIDVALDVAGLTDGGIIGYPRTFDFTNKLVFDLTPQHKLSVFALNTFETFEQSDEQASNLGRRTDRFRARRTSRRFAGGVTLSSILNRKTFAQTTVWATGAHNDGTFYIPFSNFLQRSRDLRDLRIGIKEDVTFVPRRDVEISVGGGLFADRANYYTFENTGQFYSPLEEEFNAPLRENRLTLTNEISTYGYAQAMFRPAKNLSLTPGVRLDHYGLTGGTLVSPRFGARFSPTERVALTFAAGIFRQPPSIFTMALAPANRDLKSQTATHVIGGLEWLFDASIRLRIEAFQKNYSDLAIQPVRLTQTSVADGRCFNTGRGTARGVEVSVQRSLSGHFSGQASYSYLRSRRSFDAGSPLVASDLERPHQLVLIGISQFRGFTIAAKYRVASGLPYTRRIGFLSAPGAPIIQRIASLNNVNALRLPNFASLDLRAEKRFSFRRWSFSPYIDYFNITNHDSVVQPNYEFFQPTPFFLSENRRLPIFGLRIEF